MPTHRLIAGIASLSLVVTAGITLQPGGVQGHGNTAVLECAPPIHGGDGIYYGIRFTVNQPFTAIEMKFVSDAAGTYEFTGDLRRSSGLSGPIEESATVTADLPGYTVLSPATLHFDFGYTSVSGSETFTLQFSHYTGPSTPFYIVAAPSDVCPDVFMAQESSGDVLTDRGNEPYFRVLASNQFSDRWGDTDCSKFIAPPDVLLLLRGVADHTVEGPPDCYDTVLLGAGSYSWWDLDCSGHYDLADVRLLLVYVAGFPEHSPGECPSVGHVVSLNN